MQYKIKNHSRDTLIDTLFYITLFFIGFTKALTFNLGFPLKIYEISLFLLIFVVCIAQYKMSYSKSYLHIMISLFFIWMILSTVINSIWIYPSDEINYQALFRISYIGDSLLKLFYFLLSFLFFLISYQFLRSNYRRVLTVFVSGAVLSSLVTMFYFLCSFIFGISRTPLLPGMEIVPTQTLYFLGHLVIRCGTQAEGNPLGLYLFFSFFIALGLSQKKKALIIFVGLLMTLSTIAYLSLTIYALYYMCALVIRNKVNSKFIVVMVIASMIFSVVMITDENAREFLISKLPLISNNKEHYSKTERKFFIQTAYQMGVSNPIIGVGLSHYSSHFLHYAEPFDGVDPKLYSKQWHAVGKVLPHNIYMEIFSEVGIIALLIFVFFNIFILYRLRTTGDRALFISILVYFNTIPTLSIMFIWFIYSYFVYKSNFNIEQ